MKEELKRGPKGFEGVEVGTWVWGAFFEKNLAPLI